MRSVSGVTSATAPELGESARAGSRPDGSAGAPGAGPDAWAARYPAAGEVERPLVEAALRCIARWGVRKTSLDDVAREAGVSRATVYRVFPGGKDRVVEVVFRHEAGRVLEGVDTALADAESLEDLLVAGLESTWRIVADHDVLAAVIRHEPELILPHFAFHQLDRVLDLADAVCRPHLERFLPAHRVRPAAEILARVVITFAFRPAPWLDARDPASVRRLVRTYLLPALIPPTTTSAWEITT